MSTFKETEGMAAEALQEALVLIQQAESKMSQVKFHTTGTALYRKAEDYMGTLALIRRDGNYEYNLLLRTMLEEQV